MKWQSQDLNSGPTQGGSPASDHRCAFFNSLIEMEFPHHTIHPLSVYASVTFSTFGFVQSSPHSFRTFYTAPQTKPVPTSSRSPPPPWHCCSTSYLCRLACSGHFTSVTFSIWLPSFSIMPLRFVRVGVCQSFIPFYG